MKTEFSLGSIRLVPFIFLSFHRTCKQKRRNTQKSRNRCPQKLIWRILMFSTLLGLAFKTPMYYLQHTFMTLCKRVLNGIFSLCFCFTLRLPKAKNQIKTSGQYSLIPKLVSSPLALKISFEGPREIISLKRFSSGEFSLLHAFLSFQVKWTRT